MDRERATTTVVITIVNLPVVPHSLVYSEISYHHSTLLVDVGACVPVEW